MKRLQLKTEIEDGVVVVTPEGRMDSGRVDLFEELLQEQIEQKRHNLVIDFVDTQFIASSGLRVLLKVAKQVRATAGRLIVCNLKPHIAGLFRTAGFDELLEIAPERDDAVETARPKGAHRGDGKAQPLQRNSGSSRREHAQPARRRRHRAPPPLTTPRGSPSGNVLRLLALPWRITRGVFTIIRDEVSGRTPSH